MIIFFVINNQEMVLQKIKIKINFYQIFDNKFLIIKDGIMGKREREKKERGRGLTVCGAHARQQPKRKGTWGNKKGGHG